MSARRRAQQERGAVLVEFAFIAPVLGLLLFGFLEVGLLVLGSTAGTNAAREGARVGIVQYLDADDDTSTAYAAIETRIREKLLDLVQPGSEITIEVRCLDYDAPNTQKPCDDDIDVGRDLLEVTVRWKPIVATGFVSPDARSDRARMTIIGDAGSSGGGGGGTLATLTLGCSPTNLTETNATQTVTCTVTRSNSAHEVSVTYATADGTAVSGSDYTGASGTLTFAVNGPLTQTFTIPILGDTTFEPTESFTVALAGPSNATLGSPVDATITIENDDPDDTTPPGATSIVLRDTLSPLGKVDTIVVTFDETLGSCAGTSGWSVGVPGGSGYALQSAAKGSNTVTLTLAQGTPFTTASSGFTVSYTQNANGVCDAGGNLTPSFGPTTPIDQAVPYLVGITSVNGGSGVLNRPNTGDTITLQFTEPMQATSPGTLVLQRDNGGGKNTNLTITPYVPTVNLGNITTYWGSNCSGGGCTATFTTTLAASGNDIVVTLGTCSGNCTFTNANASVTIPSFGWAPTIPKDTPGNSAANPVAPPLSAVPITVSLF